MFLWSVRGFGEAVHSSKARAFGWVHKWRCVPTDIFLLSSVLTGYLQYDLCILTMISVLYRASICLLWDARMPPWGNILIAYSKPSPSVALSDTDRRSKHQMSVWSCFPALRYVQRAQREPHSPKETYAGAVWPPKLTLLISLFQRWCPGACNIKALSILTWV